MGSAGEQPPQTAAPAWPLSETEPQGPEDIDYRLPYWAIAQTPRCQRDQARLLIDHGNRIDHRRVCDLPELLEPGDVMVVNDTRVFPARLRLRRATGGAVEVLLLEEKQDQRSDGPWWEALVRPSRRLRAGEIVGNDLIKVEIGADLGQGRRRVRPVRSGSDLFGLLDEIGSVALPPYIEDPIADRERYQTVFARRPESVAAPTAGLHLTEPLLKRIRTRGVTVASIELAIGLDTFRPVTVDRLDEHVMHSERYRVPTVTAEAVAAAGRVVAVGTTVVRALETWSATGVASGRSSLFIRRPFPWQVVDVLMTNFHLPRSTLLCLVDAFVGPRWRYLYRTALAEGYRFLSFGDAMLLHRACAVHAGG